MNNKFLFIFLLWPFICLADKLPSWVENVDCDKNDICAVGYGKNIDEAMNNARVNIQKIFETKIKSSFKSEVSNNKEDSYELLQEDSDGILKGVKITKTFKNEKDFYVLGVLDKEKLADEIGYDINRLDKKMAVLINDKSPTSSKQLEKMFKEREILNKKYLFLTGEEIKEKIKYQNVFENNKHNFSQLGSYYLNIKDEELKSFLSNLLLENDIDIVNTYNSADKIIDAKIIKKKEFLKVDGFEKYSITLNLQLLHNGKVVKSINKKITETGLSYDQIYSRAMNKIFEYLQENIINIIG